MLDVGAQISDLRKLHNVLLCDRGRHPPALVGSGHDEGSGVLGFGFRVLELEMRKGARVVEKRDRSPPLYKGGEYQASSV